MGDGRVAGRGKWVAAVVQQRVPGGSRRLHRGVGCNMGRSWKIMVAGSRWVVAPDGSRQWRVWGLLHMAHGGWVAAVGRWVRAMGRGGHSCHP